MSKEYHFKKASQHELTLYCFIGEAVCAVQHIEDALSHSIVLKKNKPRLRAEGEKLLEKHRSYTLGRAIKIAEDACLYPEPLQEELKEFLKERNWLIHKSIAQNRDELDLNISWDKLFSRIKAIHKKGLKLLQLIEEDLILFSEENGVDMTRVRNEINKYCY